MTSEHVLDDLRVQVLSPTVVRLELRGPQGFEDRPTFTVQGRDWPGAASRVEGDRVVTDGFTVVVPPDRVGLKGITLERDGRVLHAVEDLPGSQWLPDPGATGPVFALADAPRLVPPPGGAVLANATDPTSGYDTTNDAPDLYLVVTDDPHQLRQDLLRLTGPVPLIPRWALGFWDSRWYPYTDAMALGIIDEYRERGLPLDAFVLDTDWRVGASEGYGIDEALIPDMAALMEQAHARGVRVMLNDHPEPQAETALDPVETTYRWNGLTDLLARGVDVWWYDRNWWTVLHEPMPGIPKETWGASVFHDVTKAFRPDARPMIMANVDGIDNGVRNRPPHPAFHRYPIGWTGDTGARWDYLANAVDNVVTEGVLGMLPWVHEDAGGHWATPTPELFGRFLQHCALSPLLRVHCTYKLIRYPWAYGPAAEQVATEAIRFRYRLLPTLYTAAHEAHRTGLPITRRLDLEFPTHDEARDTTQYLLGDDLLVAPVLEAQQASPTPVPGELTHTWLNAERSELEAEPGVVPEGARVLRWTGTAGPAPHAGEWFALPPWGEAFVLKVDGEVSSGALSLAEGQVFEVELEIGTNRMLPDAPLSWVPEGTAGPLQRSFWVPPGSWVDAFTGAALEGPQRVRQEVTPRTFPLLVRAGGVLFLSSDQVRSSDDQLSLPVTVEVVPGPPTSRTMLEDDGVGVDAPVRELTVSHDGDVVTVGAWDRPVVLRLRAEGSGVVVDGVPTEAVVTPAGPPAEGLDQVLQALPCVEVTLPPSTAARVVELVR